MYQTTSALLKIRKLKKRLKVIQGGSSAGKTIAILLILIDRAQRSTNKLTSVVSETMPHIKRGAERDFLLILKTQGYYKDANWNATDHVYTFETGSQIEFFSADSGDKVRGPRRNGDLFLNECNNVGYEVYTQLAIRTEGDIFLDFNPVSEFWYHEEIVGKQADHDFLVVTYRDNEGLPEVIVKELESRRGNKAFWTVYGEGQLGEAEGRIFTGWQVIDDVPHEARLERYGLDFGYTNDPTAIVACYYFNGGYILDEIGYTKGLSNKQIADILLNQKRALIIADSAEPKSIDELKLYGLTVLPATKGPGSVLQRIQMMQDQQISVTKRSVNIIKQYRNYLWLTDDKTGKILNEPSPIWNHTMDAAGYALQSCVPIIKQKELMDMMPKFQERERINPAR